ncbi:unnamed protein product [Lactuca virosa]|uniref:DNA helicase Pif1-like 2B domain-containing protein n=1 Tax=Lactuca virosa TaxID=75947 RepID=A0AAU9PM34_9ASTR|nr:unnamed protein product [Lactuca virosa]
MKPAVIHLPLHLENYQPLTFKRILAKKLKLTYNQFPDHFVWKGDKNMWSPRQIGDSIGRIVIAHPTEGERYYLRILLSRVRCPKSFADLKMINGVTVATFRESALLRGYLLDDATQQELLQTGVVVSLPSSMLIQGCNDVNDEINHTLIYKLPGEEIEYFSLDETIDPNDQAQYEDLLHSLTPNGMPPHKLVLKYNAPIILLRNMNPFEGLCNGTRLFCKDFQWNVIRAEISYGEFAGKELKKHVYTAYSDYGNQSGNSQPVDSPCTNLRIENLHYYARTFTQYRRYRISNAFVIPCDPRYAVSLYEFSWVLNKRTLVQEHPNRNPVNLPCTFEFTPFTRLHEHAESDHLQNVRGIVVRCLPSYEEGSDLKLPLVITLWNQFDEHEGNMLQSMQGPPPLFFGLRLKVTTFNSISLTTKPNSGLLINPPVSEQLAITHLMKTAWVKGTLSLPEQERNLSYTACFNCFKSIEADTTWIVTCPSCHIESEIQQMSRLTVLIADESGVMKANLHTPEVEKFIPFSPKDVQISEETGETLCNSIAIAINSVYIVAFVRAYEVHFQGTTDIKVNIVKAYKVNDPAAVSNESDNMVHRSNIGEGTSTTKNVSSVAATVPLPSAAEIEKPVEVKNSKQVPVTCLLPKNKPEPILMTKHLLPEIPSSSSSPFEQKVSESVPPLALPVKEDVPRASNPRPSKKTK